MDNICCKTLLVEDDGTAPEVPEAPSVFDEFISLVKKLQLLLGPPGPSGRMGKMAKIWTWPYGPSYGPYEAFDRMDRMVLQASQLAPKERVAIRCGRFRSKNRGRRCESVSLTLLFRSSTYKCVTKTGCRNALEHIFVKYKFLIFGNIYVWTRIEAVALLYINN